MKDIFPKPSHGAAINEFATVVDINPAAFSADVVLADGRTLQGVGFVGLYGSPLSQDITWLHNLRGATVRIAQLGSEYFILYTVPAQQVENDADFSIAATQEEVGGTDPNTYKDSTYTDYSSTRDGSFLPGDKILRANSDTELSLWREGVARLKASALSQFILGKYKDFARLIARVYQFYSDFGEVKSTHNAEGRVGLHVKGGADFEKETHPQAANWTVQVWMGDYPDDPDARLFVRVNDQDGTEHVTLKYDIHGNQKIKASNDDIQEVGNDRDHTILNDERTMVGKNSSLQVLKDRDAQVGGDDTTSVDGDSELSVGGNRQETVGGNSEVSVAGNKNESVQGNESHNVAGAWDITVSGPVNITSSASVAVSAPAIRLN